MERKAFMAMYRSDSVFRQIMNDLLLSNGFEGEKTHDLAEPLQEYNALDSSNWANFLQEVGNGETLSPEDSKEIRFLCVVQASYNELYIGEPEQIEHCSDLWSHEVMPLELVLNGRYFSGTVSLRTAWGFNHPLLTTDVLGEAPIWETLAPDLPKLKIEHLVKVTIVRDATGKVQSIGVEAIKVPYKD